MSKKKSIFILLGSILLSLLLGLIVGVIIDDFPRLTLDTNIRIFEPLSFCLTIAVGIIIPFIFKSIIDDNRQIKSYLIDEIRSFSRSVEDIPDKINEYYFQKTDYITLNVPPVAFSNVPLQTWSHSVRQS